MNYYLDSCGDAIRECEKMRLGIRHGRLVVLSTCPWCGGEHADHGSGMCSDCGHQYYVPDKDGVSA